MNLPNALTIARILALPFCAWALFKNGGDDPTWQVIAWCSFFVVGMTDVLDGRIARKRNQISSFGTLLDPIADKAFIATALIGLSILEKMPWWVQGLKRFLQEWLHQIQFLEETPVQLLDTIVYFVLMRARQSTKCVAPPNTTRLGKCRLGELLGIGDYPF